MTLIDNILTFIAPITPYIEWLILFIIPIYIAIGEVFSIVALGFIQFLSPDSHIMSYTIMAIFLVLGVLAGIMSEKKQKEKQNAEHTKNTH